MRGSISTLPPREALILLAVLNHPWLLDSHAEEFAELELLHRDADQLRRAITQSLPPLLPEYRASDGVA